MKQIIFSLLFLLNTTLLLAQANPVLNENLYDPTGGNPGNPDGTFDSGTRSNGSFSHTFVSEGTFPYYCRVHGASASMTGTITITADTGGEHGGGYDG